MAGSDSAVLSRSFLDRLDELQGYASEQLLVIAMLNELANWKWTNPGKSIDVLVDGKRYCCIVDHHGLPVIDTQCRDALSESLARADVVGRSK